MRPAFLHLPQIDWLWQRIFGSLDQQNSKGLLKRPLKLLNGKEWTYLSDPATRPPITTSPNVSSRVRQRRWGVLCRGTNRSQVCRILMKAMISILESCQGHISRPQLLRCNETIRSLWEHVLWPCNEWQKIHGGDNLLSLPLRIYRIQGLWKILQCWIDIDLRQAPNPQLFVTWLLIYMLSILCFQQGGSLFQRGQKWPRKFLSSVYLLFLRQMRRFWA